MQHKLITHPSSVESMALFTKKSYGDFKSTTRSGANIKPNKSYCTHCFITGHTFETCFKARNAEPQSCTHCNMIGHVADKCYKLHGYPSRHKLHNKTKLSSNSVAANVLINEFDDDEEYRMTLIKLQYQ